MKPERKTITVEWRQYTILGQRGTADRVKVRTHLRRHNNWRPNKKLEFYEQLVKEGRATVKVLKKFEVFV